LFASHTESKLGLFGIAKKFVKNTIHLRKQNFLKQNFLNQNFLLPNQQTITFGFQGVLGIELYIGAPILCVIIQNCQIRQKFVKRIY
jgi:hypothetical protein